MIYLQTSLTPTYHKFIFPYFLIHMMSYPHLKMIFLINTISFLHCMYICILLMHLSLMSLIHLILFLIYLYLFLPHPNHFFFDLYLCFSLYMSTNILSLLANQKNEINLIVDFPPLESIPLTFNSYLMTTRSKASAFKLKPISFMEKLSITSFGYFLVKPPYKYSYIPKKFSFPKCHTVMTQ